MAEVPECRREGMQGTGGRRVPRDVDIKEQEEVL